MDKDQINQEYTEDQIFILQDIADEQRAAMEDGWDEDGAQEYLSKIAVEQRAAMEDGWDEDGAQEYLSKIAVKLMMEDHD